jgi:hypothetical protein
LAPDDIERITGRARKAQQLAWLKEHAWPHALAADGQIIVGTLYAHLRLAGLHPQDAAPTSGAAAGGFNLGATR